jgi:ABC-type enterochelin transport system substrate-binding protein
VLRRSFAALLFACALAACGGNESSAPATQADATTQADVGAAVLITTDCGATVVTPKTPVDAGETAMRSLDRVADIESDSGLVTAIEGVEQDADKNLFWLYYVNGKLAQKGAAEVKLETGDVEWWDLHNWKKECASVPPDAQ